MKIENHLKPYSQQHNQRGCEQANLDLSKIDFFPCTDGTGIGLPNHDRIFSLLIEEKMHVNARTQSICLVTAKVLFEFHVSFFVGAREARKYLES